MHIRSYTRVHKGKKIKVRAHVRQNVDTSVYPVNETSKIDRTITLVKTPPVDDYPLAGDPPPLNSSFFPKTIDAPIIGEKIKEPKSDMVRFLNFLWSLWNFKLYH